MSVEVAHFEADDSEVRVEIFNDNSVTLESGGNCVVVEVNGTLALARDPLPRWAEGALAKMGVEGFRCV